VAYTLGAAVLALVGLIVVREPHRRLLCASMLALLVGYVAVGIGLLVGGVATLAWMYIGALVLLLGSVGVLVFGLAKLWSADDGGTGMAPPF
jgi:hypothetical protein